MKSLNECIQKYKEQMERGDIQKAYKGLMEFMLNLRNNLADKYPVYSTSGNLYFGYMDMTYFSFTPEELKNKKLKIAIVFLHDKISFEVWLAGANKGIQSKYWKLFKDTGWNKYHIPESIVGIDSIIESELCPNPDFDNLHLLAKQIEKGTLKFINDIISFLSKNQE